MEFGIDLSREKLSRELSIYELESTSGWQVLSKSSGKKYREIYIFRKGPRESKIGLTNMRWSPGRTDMMLIM